MSEKTDQTLIDWGLWFETHRGHIPPNNLEKRCEFLELMVQGLIAVLASNSKDVQKLERRNSSLIIPSELHMEGYTPLRTKS